MARRLTRRRFRQAHSAGLPGVRLRPPTAAPTPVFESWVIPLLDADGHPVPLPDFLLPRSRSTAPDPPPPSFTFRPRAPALARWLQTDPLGFAAP